MEGSSKELSDRVWEEVRARAQQSQMRTEHDDEADGRDAAHDDARDAAALTETAAASAAAAGRRSSVDTAAALELQ